MASVRNVVLSASDVLAFADLAVARGVVLLQPLGDQEVHRVVVAPGLAHGAGLDAVERRVAVGVDHETVGQAVGVLVVEDARVERAAHRARTARRCSACAGSATGTSAWSAGCRREASIMLALSMWLPSGMPLSVLAPSSACSSTGSPSTASKLPAVGVKPMDAAWRASRGTCWPRRSAFVTSALPVGTPRERLRRGPGADELSALHSRLESKCSEVELSSAAGARHRRQLVVLRTCCLS